MQIIQPFMGFTKIIASFLDKRITRNHLRDLTVALTKN
ncbi:hypothetical protein Murru_0784 [Allomuricauda ruestringensis DSM 13258]|uniref:Uncharacterized protein n=1 Tax=Allomuricauda ruestringensis (strain DSM 13258 / CIP 107369 / LMG 19739 / B1) TaxID=886377 RepID=G2PJS5_ALLRU|nr:hypothetical protein Murru_0784 [Allomuricauda ruestringensis DSM 13258]